MGIIGTPLGWIMKFMYQFIENYGAVLILFTILVRVLMFPLNVKQQKSSAKMALFTPKMQQLQKQYGKNKEKYQEEMMKLYEEEGYNPMASCLPMVLQFVILFGIIDVVYKPMKHLLSIPKDVIDQATKVLTEMKINIGSSAELMIINVMQGNGVNPSTGEPIASNIFDGIFTASQVSQIEEFNMHFFGLNLGTFPSMTWPILLIPIFSGITSLVVSFVSLQQQKKNGMGNQQGMGAMKAMMYIMPLFSVWIAFSLPLGVSVYWITGNILSVIQTVILYNVYSPEKMKVVVEKENAERKEKAKNSRYRQAVAMAMEQQKAKEQQKNGSDTQNQDYHKSKEAIRGAQNAEAKKIKKEITPENITNSQIIAMARQRLETKYGSDEAEDTDRDVLEQARKRMADKYGDR